MTNTTTTFNFLIILLSYALLNSTNILLGMESKPESSTLYIQYIDKPGKFCTIPEVKLISNSSIDFTKPFEILYAKTNIIFESNKESFVLELYHYNEQMMLYKTMNLTATQTTEIINQQKDKSPIFTHGSIPKYTMLDNKKMNFINETKLFKLNFSPPTTFQSSLYQKQITTIEKELINDQATVQLLKKTTEYEKTLLDSVITLEQQLKTLELMNLNNMISNDKKMLEKIEQIIILEKKITTLKQKLQKKDTLIQNKESIEQPKNIPRNQAANRATMFFFMSKITLMITYALAHDTLLPLLFFTNLMTSLLYYSTQT